MKRTAYQHLLAWKNKENRKPLLLQGARQVGKTYLVDEFGRKEYDNYVRLNFEKDANLKTFFEGGFSPTAIIDNIALYRGEKIVAENTLLFFDEIQIAPNVLTSLKYFCEDAPEFHIIAAGSLLGVSLGGGVSFPVGKVNFLTLFPMSFSEYLCAIGEDLLDEMLHGIQKPEPIPGPIHDKLIAHLKMYLYLGGMPEVVQDYIDNKDIASVRLVQNEILKAYDNDLSKYSDPRQAIKTSEFWNSVPGQLARENKKFKYGDVRKNARAASYEQSVEWLRKAGLIILGYNISAPKFPLSTYTDYSKFKIYMHDVGLLAARLNISSDLIVTPGALFSEFNGAFIENFIAQELRYYGYDELFYWTSNSDAEVDFVIGSANAIFPVEVKSGTSTNIKSLRSYADKYQPQTIFRLSPRNLIQSEDFINVPLYGVNILKNLLT